MMTKSRYIAEKLVRRTRDTILEPPTPQELASWGSAEWSLDLGLVWHGDLKPILSALKPDERDAAIKRLTYELAGYAKFEGTGGVANNGSPTFGVTQMTDGQRSVRAERDATAALLRKMNEDNRKAAAYISPVS